MLNFARKLGTLGHRHREFQFHRAMRSSSRRLTAFLLEHTHKIKTKKADEGRKRREKRKRKIPLAFFVVSAAGNKIDSERDEKREAKERTRTIAVVPPCSLRDESTATTPNNCNEGWLRCSWLQSLNKKLLPLLPTRSLDSRLR